MRRVISEFDELCFDDVPVHVISTLVKSFFRELPEPLITSDLYENFLNASGKQSFLCNNVKYGFMDCLG